MSNEIERKVTVEAKPYLLMCKIPRCPSCHSANPEGLENCPACNEAAPPKEYFSADADITAQGELIYG